MKKYDVIILGSGSGLVEEAIATGKSAQSLKNQSVVGHALQEGASLQKCLFIRLI